jgi:hypothetical protein
MRIRTVLYVSLAMAAVGLLAACSEDTPTKPSQPRATFVGIQVMGPDSLVAGQSAQFVANIQQADGTTKSATSMPNLRWRSSNPAVMSVNNSGVATAILGGVEATITADITPLGAVQGTRVVSIVRAVTGTIEVSQPVTGTIEVSQSETEARVSYVFTLKLTESAGVPKTVTDIWITFDDGWAGWCGWLPYKLGPTRLPANGTLALDPLTCSLYGKYFDVVVSIVLKDDNGRITYVELYRVL